MILIIVELDLLPVVAGLHHDEAHSLQLEDEVVNRALGQRVGQGDDCRIDHAIPHAVP